MTQATRGMYEMLKDAEMQPMMMQLRNNRKILLSSLTDQQRMLYGNIKRNKLSREFCYIYELLGENGQIDIKQSESAKPYDVNIITILFLIKIIHKATRGKNDKKIPIPNRNLIVAWGLSFDNTYIQLHGKIWDKQYRGAILGHKPRDYEQYLKDGNLNKLKNKNSFHKYMIGAENNGLKDKIISFLGIILSEIDKHKKYDIEFKWGEEAILDRYEEGFVKIVNGMSIGRKDMDNIDYLWDKKKSSGLEGVLNVIDVQCKSKLYDVIFSL